MLHADARLSGDERPTTEAVLANLPDGLPVQRVAGTGAVVRVGVPGPAVAVRAELDALPILEQTGVGWASTSGAMHACGHDVHMAAAVALAHAVHRTPGAPPLLLLLQPREEGMDSGALDILESGVLAAESVAAVLGAHVQPLLPAGTIACAPGAVNASADEFTVVMRGQPGHAAYPHLGADPVLAAAHFVVAAQQLVSRETDPMSAAVVSVGVLNAGVSPNVRPDHATVRGTVRAMSAEHRKTLLTRLEAVAEGVALAGGCAVAYTATLGEPVLVNDAALAARTQTRLPEFGLAVTSDLRSCGADDFAYYGEQLPALMMFVGTGDGAGQLHSATFLPADRAIEHTALALLAGYCAASDPLPSATERPPRP